MDKETLSNSQQQKKKRSLRKPSSAPIARNRKPIAFILAALVVGGAGFFLGQESSQDNSGLNSPLVTNQAQRENLYGINSVALSDFYISSQLTVATYANEPGVDVLRKSSDENTESYTEVIRSLYGDDAATKFAEVWKSRTDALVQYAEAAKNNDQQKKDEASVKLKNEFPQNLSQALESSSNGLKESNIVIAHANDLASFQIAIVEGRANGDFSAERQQYSDARRSIEAFSKRLTEIAVSENADSFKSE